MPIVQVFKGSYTVEGLLKTDYKTQFYKKTVDAYGETIGELLDNLVTASITLANDVFEWTMANRGPDYKFKDDYWSCNISHPDIEKSLLATPETDHLEVGGGSSLDSIEDIVKYAALSRDISTNSVLTFAQIRRRGEDSQLPEQPKRDYMEVTKALTFQEITRCGWTGTEIDEILQIAVREGRLEAPKDFLPEDEVAKVTPVKRKGFWNR